MNHPHDHAGVIGYPPVIKIEKAPRPPEAEIYKQMWSKPEYRTVAPGAHSALIFLKQAQPKVGATLIDYGCGTGRGAAMLAATGLNVTGVDFADNCLDEEIKNHLPFVVADLTKPLSIHSEYGFCTDVMEHIPPEDVDAVLDNILQSSQHCFFQISTVDDVMGGLIGHPLHLTIRPFDWWLKKFKDRDCHVQWTDVGQFHCSFYVTAWQDGQAVVDIGVLNAGIDIVKKNVEFNVQQGWQQVTPHETQETEVMILGGGPSMNEHLEEIRELRSRGVKIITLNGAYNWAIDHGLSVSATVIVDAREFNRRFVQPVLPDTKYLIASQCDPSVYEGLPKDRTYQWHTSAEDIVPILDEHLDVWYAVPGGSTVLLRTIPLLRMMGYHWFHLFGCDSCLQADAHHSYAQPENDEQIILPVTVGGRVFRCYPWMVSQAQEFITLVKVLGSEFELEVYGDGLLRHIVETGAELGEAPELVAA